MIRDIIISAGVSVGMISMFTGVKKYCNEFIHRKNIL